MRAGRSSAHTDAPVRMMISYAHKDEKLRVAFDDHLALLRNHKLVDVWQDRCIRAGGDWAHDIHKNIEKADIILLLVSPAFFGSRYITGIELKRALERAAEGTAVVIPIILKEGDYRNAPFAHLKELPTDGLAKGRAVNGRRWKNYDEAFRDVTEGIRDEVERLRGKRLEHHAVLASVAKQKREPSAEDRAEIRGLGESFGRIVAGRRVLWVDDHPEGNDLERAAIEQLRVRVDTATDTAKAIKALTGGSYDLVISDWTRGAAKRKADSEGLRLLKQMRKQRMFAPFIVYCGWLGPRELARRRKEIAEFGGSGLTAAPRELLRWSIGELVRAAAFDPQAEFVEAPLYPEPQRPGR
jgi:CheY-like chemotaxis protein